MPAQQRRQAVVGERGFDARRQGRQPGGIQLLEATGDQRACGGEQAVGSLLGGRCGLFRNPCHRSLEAAVVVIGQRDEEGQRGSRQPSLGPVAGGSRQ